MIENQGAYSKRMCFEVFDVISVVVLALNYESPRPKFICEKFMANYGNCL